MSGGAQQGAATGQAAATERLNVASSPVIAEHDVTVYLGDVREQLAMLPAGSVQCVVTSPPYYGLRDYGVEGQRGQEATPAEYVAALCEDFRHVRRTLADDGVLWLNLADSYSAARTYQVDQTKVQRSGISRPYNTLADRPAKNLLGLPWRVAFALQDDGWTLRNAVIWHKLNAMPESVTDRLACKYEHIFLFSKSRKYRFDIDAIREARAAATLDRYRYAFKANGNPASSTNHLSDGGMMPTRLRHAETDYRLDRDHDAANPDGKNPGDVWAIASSPFPGAHFAVFPPEIPRRCILAGCPSDGIVLDPFAGSGTTLKVARSLGRKSVGIELNPDYIDIIRDRIGPTTLDFGACCEHHNRNCEPPSELCCDQCPEFHHGLHADQPGRSPLPSHHDDSACVLDFGNSED